MGFHAEGGTSRFDPNGIIYQGVCALGFAFDPLPDAWSTTAAGWDIAVYKIDFGTSSAIAAAAASPSEGCALQEIDFLNFSTGSHFIWDFGDGSPISFDVNPSHTYTEPGIYSAMLISVDSSSCNISDTAYVNIVVGSAESIEASFDYSIECTTQTLSLFNTTEGPAVLFDFTWHTGDGTSYNSMNPTHTYGEPGIYQVSLEVTDSLCGGQGIYTQLIEVLPNVLALIDAEEVDFCVDGSVAFSFAGENALDFEWTFGDGETSGLQDPMHTFGSPGTFEIVLIATNPNTCNDSDTATVAIEIPVIPEIQASFEVSQTGNCNDLTFVASSLSTGAIDQYHWIFNGDTLPYSDPTIVHSAAASLHELTLLITENSCQFTSDTTAWVDLISSLSPDFPQQFAICHHDDFVEIDAGSPADSVSYTWYPGGEQSPAIIASQPGIYSVVIHSPLCIDSLSTIVVDGVMFGTGYRFEACGGFPVEIAIDFPQVNNVEWGDGNQDHPRIVMESGEYPYTFTDHLGCLQGGTIFFDPLPESPNLEIPNVITPNNDGRNDVFIPQGGELTYYRLGIFNRWGNSLFTTDEIYGEWDGVNVHTSEQVAEGTYFYVITYQGICQKGMQQATGPLQVFRHHVSR